MIETPRNQFRYRVHQILEAGVSDDLPSRACDIVIIVMILLNVAAFVLGSVGWIAQDYANFLYYFEVFSIIFFTIEYVLRIWACVEHIPLRSHTPLKARLKFALQPMQVIDLIAILPFYLGALVGADLRALRILRLFRFFKILRYSTTMQVLIKVFYNEGRALLGALMIMLALILLASSVMHYIEGDVQPETFGDIPSSMWWALATLTTVGFGDAVPVTTLGKIWSGLFMVFGLGMFALPIGIISTGFAREINRREFVINWNMVARVPVFNQLQATEVAEIMELLQSQRFPKDVLIFEKGQEATAMYFIVAGEVEIDDGKKTTQLEAGEFFGEVGMLSKGSYLASARVVSNSHLLQLERADFEYLLHKNEKLNNHIRRVATQRMMDEHQDD